MKAYRTIWPYIKEHRLLLFCGFFALIICDLLQLVLPMIIGQSIDLLASTPVQKKDLAHKTINILILAVSIALTRFAWRRLVIGFSRTVEKKLRSKLHFTLLILPLSWHHKKTSGELMALATNDIESVRMASSLGMVSLIDAVVMGTVAMIFMYNISPRLMVLAMLPLPVISISTLLFGNTLYKRYHKVQESFADLTESIREELSGIKILKAMSLEPLALERSEKSSSKNLRQNVKLSLYSGMFFPLMTLFTQLAIVVVLYFGGKQALIGEISPGNFVAFIGYLGLLVWPMLALGLVYNLIQRGAVSLDRLNKVLNETLKTQYLSPPSKKNNFKSYNIKSQNLDFCYPNRTEKTLANLNLDFEAGKISALVGPTGSGKSTLVALITGLILPPEKTLLIADRWIEDWNLEQLRSKIGYVPQDGYTFSGNIYDNLVFGRPDASLKEAWQAAHYAGLASELNNFPDKLETTVGERGVTLSGGQKQRLALARALLIDPEILILDDTLSAVDATMEEEILNNLNFLRKNRTTIIISHRLTSLAGADKIFVLQNGKLDAQGTFEQLIKQEGYFRRIWKLQMTIVNRKKIAHE